MWGWGWTLTVNPISAGGLWVQGSHGSRESPQDADRQGSEEEKPYLLSGIISESKINKISVTQSNIPLLHKTPMEATTEQSNRR